ncbi:MAG TPA: cob(I)yrinic acid a,c-diamide adenosyltransferase [Negativicutes bacterium]|nr:cob(I)yrinic acid a,c-diamide adenosyltransferase [Negativicutes bacterium]
MGHIYTKKGDAGETGLLGGSQTGKYDLKVSCYGTFDEANSSIGVAYSLSRNRYIREKLREIQQRLFTVCAELACDEKGYGMLRDKIQLSDIQSLEKLIDSCEEHLGPLSEFIIPGGSTASAAIHVARTIIRRGERLAAQLNHEAGLRPELLQYINRLSDALFMLAREEEQQEIKDILKSRVIEKLASCPDKKSLALETVKHMAEACENKAFDMGVPVVFAAVDEAGNLVLLHRMAGVLPASLDIAPNKAFTAAVLRMATHEVAMLVQPGRALYGLQWTNQNRIVPFGGGFPLELGGKVIGAIGVSGGSVEEDMEIAAVALDIFKEERGNLT